MGRHGLHSRDTDVAAPTVQPDLSQVPVRRTEEFRSMPAGYLALLIRQEIRDVIAQIERRIGAPLLSGDERRLDEFCTSLASIVRYHEGIRRGFFHDVLRANLDEIVSFYLDHVESVPVFRGGGLIRVPVRPEDRPNVFLATITATLVGNLYRIDPLALLQIAYGESRFSPTAAHRSGQEVIAIGLYQIHRSWNRTVQPEAFNHSIEARGGHRITQPINFFSDDIVMNSIGAGLILSAAIAHRTSDQMSVSYAVYGTGRGEVNPLARARDRRYQQERGRYRFVIVESE